MAKVVSAESRDTIHTYRRNFQARLKRQLETRETARHRALRAVREKAPAILSDCPSVHRAYLFGSVTRPGAFHTGSDVDIAVEGATVPGVLCPLARTRASLTGFGDDVRDITSPSPFADLVRQTGVLIYERADSSATSRDLG